MSKSTKYLLYFIAMFSAFSAVGTLISSMIGGHDVPCKIVIGGLACGFILTYLVRSYDNDKDDFMPKK